MLGAAGILNRDMAVQGPLDRKTRAGTWDALSDSFYSYMKKLKIFLYSKGKIDNDDYVSTGKEVKKIFIFFIVFI